MTSLDSRKRTRLLPVAGLIILIIAIGIILFAGRTGMSRESIEQRLHQFSDQISGEAAQSGKEAHFTYGTISMEGWGFNKYAVIDDVSLELAEKSVLDTSRWSLSTTKMLAEQDPVLPGNMIFSLPDPINVIENSQIKTVVTFSTPFKFSYYNGIVDGKHTVQQSFHFPDKIFLTPVQTAGEPADKSGSAVISYDENPEFHIISHPDIGDRQASYEFHNIKIATGEGAQATIASISSKLTEHTGEDKRPAGNYTLMIVDLALRDSEKTSKTYTINANFDYTGDVPALDMTKLSVTPGNSSAKLNQLLLTTDDFKIRADGSIAMAPEDPLPSGAVTVSIDNVQAFLSSELVPEASRPAVAAALQKITGQPVGSLTNIAIPLKREKNGVLYVGDVTFEELAASMLTSMIKQAPPAPGTPAAPAGTEPAPAMASPAPAATPQPAPVTVSPAPAQPASPAPAQPAASAQPQPAAPATAAPAPSSE